MNPIQLPFLVEGILIAIAMVFGVLVSRGKRPYGKVKVSIHLFFYLWLTVGYVFIVSPSAIQIPTITWIALIVMGVALATQLASGIAMLVSKQDKRTFIVVHVTSAIVMLVSDLTALITTANIV